MGRSNSTSGLPATTACKNAVQFRDIDGKPTAYKYLVVRMKGKRVRKNVSGNGVLMMSIGGGDGSHARAPLTREGGRRPDPIPGSRRQDHAHHNNRISGFRDRTDRG